MNNIKSTFAILVVAAVLAMGVCSIAYESDATETSIGTVTYSSIDGFNVHLDDIESGQVGISFPNNGVSGGGMLVDHNLHVDIEDVNGRLTEGTGYQGQLLVRPMLPVPFTMDIAEMTFNVNGGNGSTATVYMSTGVNSLPDLGFEGPNGERFIGWATTSDATDPVSDYEIPVDGATLYAIYEDTPVTEEVTIDVTGNGAIVTADGLVDGTITAEVGTTLTFDVQAQTGYTLEGATYTYNGQTVPITGGSFTIEVVEGADTLVVNAVRVYSVTFDQPANGSLTVEYDGQEITSGTEVPKGAVLTITATADEGYELESLTVNQKDFPNGGTHTVDGNVTIAATFTDNGGPGPDPEPEYDVTVEVNNSSWGTASAYPTSAEEGETVTLSYTANDGYRFVEWRVTSGGVTITDNSFEMPGHDVTVTAVFEEIPPTEYTVTVIQADHGTASASPTSATAGTLITLTANPDDGYVLDYWVINGENVYRDTFTMPEGNVTVTPVFRLLETYDVTIDISGNGSVYRGNAELTDDDVISVRELDDLVLTYTAGEDNYTVRCSVSDENARVHNSNGTVTVSGIRTEPSRSPASPGNAQ